MRRSTLWIPVHRQPPVLLLAAVIIASLCPVAVQLLTGRELAQAYPALPEIVPTASAATTPTEPVDKVVPTKLALEATGLLAAVVPIPGGTEAEPVPEPEPETILILEEDPEDMPRAHPKPRSTRVQPVTPIDRALKACRHKDKETARDTYRRLPLGDTRRKKIRKACREQGVLIL